MEENDPMIDLKSLPTVVCDGCGGMFFKEVTLIKKVSSELVKNENDTIVPFPTYRCDDCGHVNPEFLLFDENNTLL
jgi:uncharacterized Zn finger protein